METSVNGQSADVVEHPPSTLSNNGVAFVLRELLRHADSLRASEVTVLLDSGHVDRDGSSIWQPALLVYHDVLLTEKQWEEIERLSFMPEHGSRQHRFPLRHILDMAKGCQLLSGSHIATFQLTRGSQGSMVRGTIAQDQSTQAPELAAFRTTSLPVRRDSDGFLGTIWRIPLCCDGGLDSLDLDQIGPALVDFVLDELNIGSVFTSSISAVAIHGLVPDGTVREMARSIVKIHAPSTAAQQSFVLSCRETETWSVMDPDSLLKQRWYLLEMTEDSTECLRAVNEAIGIDVCPRLEQQGLRPRLCLAKPADSQLDHGKLCDTFPLNILTPFPFHINAMFSLAPDGLGLRDAEEVVESSSLDELLIEWNRAIFTILLPAAWAALLNFMAAGERRYQTVHDAFALWPGAHTSTATGDSIYWKDVLESVIRRLISDEAMVWPLFSSNEDDDVTLVNLATNRLVATPDHDANRLRVLLSVGVDIVVCPSEVATTIASIAVDRLLTPRTVHQALLHHPDRLREIPKRSRRTLLNYLLQDGLITNIVGLPILFCADRSVFAVSLVDHAESSPRLCLDKREIGMFSDSGALPDDYIRLKSLPACFKKCDFSAVDLTRLRPCDVQGCMRAILTKTGAEPGNSDPHIVARLKDIWKWLGEWKQGDAAFDVVSDLRALPVADGSLRIPRKGLLHSPELSPSTQTALEQAGVPIYPPTLGDALLHLMERKGCVFHVTDVEWLLSVITIPLGRVLGVSHLDELRRTLAVSLHSVILSASHQRLLRALPIHPIATPHSEPDRLEYGPIPEDHTIKFIRESSYSYEVTPSAFKSEDESLSTFVLPHPEIPNVTFVVDDGVAPEVTYALDRTLSILSFQDFARLVLDHLPQQSRELQITVLRHFHDNTDAFYPHFAQQLAGCAFVPVGDGSLRPPARVFHPDSDFACRVLTADHSQYPRLQDEMDTSIIEILGDLGLLAREPSALETLPEEDEHDDLSNPAMGEALTTRISNALRQYGIDQTLTEFLANAVDAGARKLDIVVDEKTYRPSSTNCKNFSGALTELQAAPGLMIHNDAVFTMEDFEGIRRVGLGSKRWKVGKIGRFGLGSLAAFHYTEVVMIISGEYVMFLDPSMRYISVQQNRTTLMMKICDLRRRASRYLRRFDGLFGFSKDQDVYPQTIFWLPLRGVSHAELSLLSNTPVSPEDALAQVQSYYETARESTFFVAVDRVAGLYRSADGPVEDLWEVTAERTQRANMNVAHGLLSVHSSLSPDADKWRTVSRFIPKNEFPPQFHGLFNKHLLADTLSVALAANEAAVQSHSKLFCSLPLPITLQFPVNVHASFILADDRRSIRFDDSGIPNAESSFNRWLLSDAIPDLFLALLEAWPLSLQDTKLWPNPESCKDPLSKAMADSIYRTLDTSSARVCQTVTNARISPAHAVLLRGVPTKVANILLIISPPDLVKPPAAWRTVSFKSIQHVNSSYLRNQIIDASPSFVALWNGGRINPSDVSAMLRYFAETQSIQKLIDLPLVPLTDESLGVFHPLPSADCFYLLRGAQSIVSDLFPSSRKRFVFGDLDGFDASVLLNQGLNILPLSDDFVARLVKRRISSTSGDLILSDDDVHWVQSLWTSFADINNGGLIALLKDVPLVAASGLNRTIHISLVRCEDSGILPLPATAGIKLPAIEALKRLGVFFVDVASSPPSLREQLASMEFSLNALLDFFSHISAAGINEGFSALPLETWEDLAEWLRDELSKLSSKDSLDKIRLERACLLPIWPGVECKQVDDSRRTALVSPELSFMLPSAAPLHVVLPFLKTTVNWSAYHTTLHNVLDIKSLEWRRFRDLLEFETTLTDSVIQRNYIPLLTIITRHHSDTRPFLVPNTYGLMMNSAALFAHSVDLFRVALDTRQDLFLHPLIRSRFEKLLAPFGTRTAINFKSFKICVQAIHDTPPGYGGTNGLTLVQRAQAAYQWYTDNGISQRNIKFEDLEDLRFIPRALSRKRSPKFSLAAFVVPLPEVVAPRELLLDRYQAIAWTQRGLFPEAQQPTGFLLERHGSLGVPTIEEVMRHLCVLAKRVAAVHRYDLDVISDLLATYKYLSDHGSCQGLQVPFHKHRNEPVFLNVNDPTHEWTFMSAADILIDAPEGELYTPVRRLLYPFEHLLLLFGARRITKPTAIRRRLAMTSGTNIDGTGLAMASKFNELRRSGRFTDAVLVDRDGGEHRAHRLVLVCHGDHLDDMFSGNIGTREAREDAHPGDPIRVEMPFFSGECLEAALDYFYSGKLSERAYELQVLADLLELSDYWNMPLLRDLIQAELIDSITPWNVDDLYECASTYRANVLMEACTKYKSDNAMILDSLPPSQSQSSQLIKREPRESLELKVVKDEPMEE